MENRNSCWTHRKSHNGMAYLMRLNNLFCYLCDTLGVQLACFCRYFHLVSAQHCSWSAHSHKRKNGWNCIFFDLFFILSTLCSRFNASIPSSPNAANKSTIFFRHRIETKKKAGRDREMVEIEKEKKKQMENTCFFGWAEFCTCTSAKREAETDKYAGTHSCGHWTFSLNYTNLLNWR